MVGEKILGWVESIVESGQTTSAALQAIDSAKSVEELAAVWDALPAATQTVPVLKWAHDYRLAFLGGKDANDKTLFAQLAESMLEEWLQEVQKYKLEDPTKAKETLGKMAEFVMDHEIKSLALEMALGVLPNTLGTVAAEKVKSINTWLGFGAVVNAIAHDPVKIGLLRPWQDSLEATYRNRRPDDFALFQAYKTRELSPAKIEDLSKLDNKAMDAIEAENQKYYDAEIAKWGYSEWFAGALARSATVTLNFTQLNALARQGLLTRGLAIYSLWGQGYDRVVMRPALDALMRQNEMASYEGFRSLVEPAYVEGDLPEADLISYWDRIMVPKDVQAWVLPRLRKARQRAQLKEEKGAVPKERDLTVSQITAAFVDGIISRNDAQKAILDLGYSEQEKEILLKLAEARKKAPSSATQKRLPLSDYEKAYKAKLIKLDQVIERMKGEYSAYDIELERRLLEVGKA